VPAAPPTIVARAPVPVAAPPRVPDPDLRDLARDAGLRPEPALKSVAPPAATPPLELPLRDDPPSARAKASPIFDHIDAKLAAKLVVDQQMAAGAREQYRRLAAALHHAQENGGLRVVMIASAVAGEGKTLTASNLALTLSESYQRNVLLIDADLRMPSLHTVFRIPGSPGLVEGLNSETEPRLPLHQVSARLTILTAGNPSNDPMAGLTSPRMRRLLDEARESFDWVIIDTPPVGLLTDAALLGAMADGTVMVVKAKSTPHDLVKRAIDALGVDRLLGVVLNRADEPHAKYGYKSAYYNSYQTAVSGETGAR
jgi:capsular exopolysaccharide synthesis family protein